MSQDLETLIAQSAKTRKAVKDAQAVRDAAERILTEAVKRDGEANRALYDEVDNQVRGAEVAG